MKNRTLLVVVACLLAAGVFMARFCVWTFFWADNLYDSVIAESFSGLPTVKAGRVMPLSSAAADLLKSVSGRSCVNSADGKTSATKWFVEANANPEAASKMRVLRSDNRDLIKTLGGEGRYFSYSDLEKNYDLIAKNAKNSSSISGRAAADAIGAGNVFATSCQSLGVLLGGSSSFAESAANWRNSVSAAAAEISAAAREKRDPSAEKLAVAGRLLGQLRDSSEIESAMSNAIVRAIPSEDSFKSASEALLVRSPSSRDLASELAYAKLLDSVKSQNPSAAAEHLKTVYTTLKSRGNIDFTKLRIENISNSIEPFFGGFALYCCSLFFFFLGFFFVRIRPPAALFAAIFLLCGVAAQTLGICLRMYIQGRPPVTNLYSSIVFAGAIAALIGAWLFIRKRSMIFGVAATSSGALSLLVAMNLPYSGDTMGMMRAVLNSNFWLTLHVVTIMIGYCGVFLAGFIASFRIVANLFERNSIEFRNSETASSVYSILCFALLASFAGTMLGGIWADMSWGRFWGWDPKENGALMIVLWCAASIHARIMKTVGDRAFLAMAVFGNVVAAWAWFGVNLMGVGLHAYGFLDGGWTWFSIFILTQIIIILLGLRRGA